MHTLRYCLAFFQVKGEVIGECYASLLLDSSNLQTGSTWTGQTGEFS